MRRPNPWVAIPSLAGGVIAGFIAWVVTDVSCRRDAGGGFVRSCPSTAALISVVSFLAVTFGLAVVLVLVYRSLAEYREASLRGEQPPGPGCETGEL